MADASREWYGAPPPAYSHAQQAPPPAYQVRQPYIDESATRAVRTRTRRHWDGRRCGFLYSVVRQFSLLLPIILVVVTAWVYIRHSRYGGDTSSGTMVPLYLAIPLSVANILWSIAVMVNHRAVPHGRRAYSQRLHFGVELVLATGATVCLIFSAILLTRGDGDDDWWDGGTYISLSFVRSLVWLLAMQMVASTFLCARAASEVLRERRSESQQESYTIR